MAATFQLSVLTPTERLFEDAVESIVVPGTEGYLGVLAHHAPLITGLMPGKLTIKLPGGVTREFMLSGGFFEVSHNKAIVLADSAT